MTMTEETNQYLRAISPDHDAIQKEMAEHADEQGFPIIGPEAGGVLRSLARATDAQRVFEFGSGFGYSAYWFLQGMPEDGGIVLTEYDADELAMAENFFERAGVAAHARFEHGDALDIVEQYDGPFDLVLIDHQKNRYPDAFAAIREHLPVGSVVVADNVMREPVVHYFGSNSDFPENDQARGLIEYVETVRGDDDFHTVVLPVGNGIAVTTREHT